MIHHGKRLLDAVLDLFHIPTKRHVAIGAHDHSYTDPKATRSLELDKDPQDGVASLAMPMPTCPSCGNTASITLTRGPGRTLAGYAQTPEGARLEIPHDLVVPTCACGTRILDAGLLSTLHTFEQSRVGAAFPLM